MAFLIAIYGAPYKYEKHSSPVLMFHPMDYYHLTCSQNFYGQKDAKTYYSVPARKVWAGLRFMVVHFNVEVIFVYRKEKNTVIGKNTYVGSYSKKYDNFRTSGGLFKTFNF